jgi:hypothetical protein
VRAGDERTDVGLDDLTGWIRERLP